MYGLRHAPDHALVGGVSFPMFVEEEVGTAAAGGRVGGEEAEGFFNDGEGVGELVE